MEFEMLDQEVAGKTIIKVVGVGGAGGNAVQHMIRRGVNGVEFICMNTDAGALQRSEASVNLQLGSSGLGAGAKPEIGAASAEEARQSPFGLATVVPMLLAFPILVQSYTRECKHSREQ